MSDWFQHLSGALADNGLAVYLWLPAEDRYQWAGNSGAVFGLPPGECPATNASFHRMLNPQYAPQRLASLHSLLAGSAKEFSAVYKVRSADGAHVDVEETASLHKDEAGRTVLRGVLKVAGRDGAGMSGENEARNLFDSGAAHNGRLALRRRIDEWAETPVTHSENSYLLVVGMDRLSLMNEAFGVRFVDELIAKTGDRLARLVGDAGFVARIDGDVFGMFFEQASLSEMEAVARYVLGNFYEMPLQTEKGPIGISVSIGGVIVSRHNCRDTASPVTKAELAMRAAKEKGRSCFVSYDEVSDKASQKRRLFETGDKFLKALKENRIKLAFQPVFDPHANAVSFHECLARMFDEQGKIVAAGDFFPALEKLGLSRLIDQYALRSAIEELGQFPDLCLSVNVSNLTLTNQDWLRGLVAALRDRPSVARRLIVEITETVAMDDVNLTRRVTRTLQDLGCRVALDDFGSGFTAFSQLRDLDLDIVKIDKSFIRNLSDDKNQLFVRTLQSLAEGFGLETVGEGAETMADVRKLTGDGIHHIQGYIYGFPRVERVWLPRNHAFRTISHGKTEESDEELRKEIAAL